MILNSWTESLGEAFGQDSEKLELNLKVWGCLNF
jgi:hypothetical protein